MSSSKLSPTMAATLDVIAARFAQAVAKELDLWGAESSAALAAGAMRELLARAAAATEELPA